MDNQLSYWYTAQVVTASQMNDFSRDIYQRFGFITENPAACILHLDGTITEGGGNVDVPDGSFRFATTSYAFLPYNTPIFGNALAATVAVSGNGFVVARSTVTPALTGETNYNIAVTYLFTASPTTADCIICEITGGLISGYGSFFINKAATAAETQARTSTSVALTPKNIDDLFPDIVDNPLTGEVDIGIGTIKSGQKFINIQHNTFPTHQSVFIEQLNGDYTNAAIQTVDGTVNHQSTIYSSIVDGGDGVFKPFTALESRYEDAQALVFMRPAGPTPSNFMGLEIQSLLFSSVASNNGSVVHQLWDDSLSADRIDIATLTGGVANAGIQIVEDKRPVLFGDVFGAQLATAQTGSLMALGDIGGNLTGSYFTLPGINVAGSGGGKIKINTILITLNPTQLTGLFSWPIAYTANAPLATATYYLPATGVRGNLSLTPTTTDVTVDISDTDVAALNPNGVQIMIFAIGI